MKPHKGLIENWSEASYEAGKCIWGFFEGHPQFTGSYGHTSLIVSKNGNEIETLNSRYTLGKSEEHLNVG